MPKHGGKREGAGRPAPHGAKRLYTVRLSREIVGWLRQQHESQATIIERALRHTYDLPPTDHEQ